MRRPGVVLLSLLALTTNAFAQTSDPPAPKPSQKEKSQALSALSEARAVLFPIRRNSEAIQLLSRIAPLLAVSGDAAGAQDVLYLLPKNQRDTTQLEIVSAQLHIGEFAPALEMATAIAAENVRAQALLAVAQAQAAAGDFRGAIRTASLIAPDSLESAQALLEIAKQQKQPDQRSQAAQLLLRAAAIAAALPSSNDGSPDCGLGVLVQIASAQQSIYESAEAQKTLRLVAQRVPESDQSCRFGTTRFLQDSGQGPAFAAALTDLRDQLFPGDRDSDGQEESTEELQTSEAIIVDADSPRLRGRLGGFVQGQQPPPTPEQSGAVLDSLNGIRPPHLRAQAAIGTSQSFLATGKTAEAEQAIRVGLQAADSAQDENLRAGLLASRALARAAAKDWEGARNTVEQIPDGPYRMQTLQEIASSATAAGQFQLALSWATAERSPLSEARVLVIIVEVLLHQPQLQPIYVR